MTEKKGTSEAADVLKTRNPGWATMRSTSAFRAINFELFVRPNKYVMAVRIGAFGACISYIAYMNLTNDNKNKPTYVSYDEEGTLTTRPKKSIWD